MDIATNKVTEDEMLGIPHHLMSFISTNDEYSVVNFVADARAKIHDIQSRNKIPIVEVSESVSFRNNTPPAAAASAPAPRTMG